MLKKLRVGFSVLMIASITFYFLDFAGLLPAGFKILTKFQFVPALLSLSLLPLAVIIFLTLLFGRLYCSIICPLGIFQDIINRIFHFTRKKRQRFKFSKPQIILRWSVLAAAFISFLLGFTVILGLLDPYAAYGRMTGYLLEPVYKFGNNILASLQVSFGNLTPYSVDNTILIVFPFIVSVLTFLTVGFLAWKHGRTYCNTICPVGTILGFLSKYSLFKIRINLDKCNNCGLCEMRCKSSCIESKGHYIDYSRCVTCYNCINSCKKGAISFLPPHTSAKTTHPYPSQEWILRKINSLHSATDVNLDTNIGKRHFLSISLVSALAAPTVLAQVSQTITPAINGNSDKRTIPLSPPGSISSDNLLRHCTSCHLCIDKCPSHVLKPAFLEYGLGGIMQPLMYFDNGFCNYDCTLCSEICPSGAIKPLTVDRKHKTQVGRVVLHEDKCVVRTNGTNCGACSEHCPTQAVSMVPYKDGLTLPRINPDLCVGCGGCEHICPVRPNPAIYPEGNGTHLEAKIFVEPKIEDQINTQPGSKVLKQEDSTKKDAKEVKIDDFGF